MSTGTSSTARPVENTAYPLTTHSSATSTNFMMNDICTSCAFEERLTTLPGFWFCVFVLDRPVSRFLGIWFKAKAPKVAARQQRVCSKSNTSFSTAGQPRGGNSSSLSVLKQAAFQVHHGVVAATNSSTNCACSGIGNCCCGSFAWACACAWACTWIGFFTWFWSTFPCTGAVSRI